MSGGARFEFGDNWKRYLTKVDQGHVEEAMRGLARLVQPESLVGRRFVDVGSGSGIHSLAALRLGASEVRSFDYDAASVAATRQLWEREKRPANWRVDQGSILDPDWLEQLGTWEVVYSWGVLHHTGSMWQAIRNTASLCQPEGLLVIGIYNRKPIVSTGMKWMKRSYVAAPRWGRRVIKASYWATTSALALLRGRKPLAEIREYRQHRGMDYWRDLEDWVGGWPYECATPAEVEAFVGDLGFSIELRRTFTSSAAVNEFVFRRHRGGIDAPT